MAINPVLFIYMLGTTTNWATKPSIEIEEYIQ